MTINRRDFSKTLSLGLAGLLAPQAFGANPRRRAAERGEAGVFESAGGRLFADLEAAERQVTLPRGAAAKLFTFNGRIPGPRFETRAGDEVTIRFRNALAETTNLHFHGLHVPPTGVADNVFLHVPPNETLTYNFTIPANHQAGLFWVHPHHHGLVARQVSRGLAAPFVIRGEIDAIPEVAAASEHILLLQDWEIASNGVPVEPSMDAMMMGREGSLVTAGGTANPTIPILEGGLVRLRLVNASPSRFYRLQLESHPLHVIGTDGGALGSTRTVDEILFVPGERLDILVHGSRSFGSFRLLSLPYDRGGMMPGMSTPSTQMTVATFQYMGRSPQQWTIPQSLVTAPAKLAPGGLPSRTFSLGQSSAMPGMGMSMSFTINDRTFDHDRVDAAPKLGTTEDWTFVNRTQMDHPMHLHTNSFQVIGSDGQPEQAWRDIILVKKGAIARFRVRFDDFRGKAVQHCHILDHEDLGMMATVEMT